MIRSIHTVMPQRWRVCSMRCTRNARGQKGVRLSDERDWQGAASPDATQSRCCRVRAIRSAEQYADRGWDKKRRCAARSRRAQAVRCAGKTRAASEKVNVTGGAIRGEITLSSRHSRLRRRRRDEGGSRHHASSRNNDGADAVCCLRQSCPSPPARVERLESQVGSPGVLPRTLAGKRAPLFELRLSSGWVQVSLVHNRCPALRDTAKPPPVHCE